MKPDCVLRARRDVLWQTEADGWLVFDPLSRLSYRCGQAERWLFDQFDGRQSLADISRQWAIRPDHPAVSWPELQALAQALLSRGLVRKLNDAPEAESKSRPQTWLQWFSQSVSWRLRGINPSGWPDRVVPYTEMFFSKVAVRGWIITAWLVGLLVLADFERLTEQATLWQWLMTPASGSTLFVIFLITRGIHELGHALVLTRMGGRCPDIGVIFMLGAPCVYCDVTESWRLRSAQQRAAVAAGGMYAEMIVATCAAVLWLCTAPSLVNTLALQTMIVCSISTWLVNANPLMRFDGYYILSDWLGETNLRARADECCMRIARRWLLGTRESRPLKLSIARERGLALFSLGGFIYRLSLSWMMASVIVALYAAWHFAWLGRMIAGLLLLCWWGIPAMKFVMHLWRSAKSIWSRMRLGLLTAWVVLMVCAVPLPYRVSTPGWIQPERMQGLYAPATVRLLRVHQSAGALVHAGDVLIQLDSHQPRLRSIELKRTAEGAQLQLAALRSQQRRRDDMSLDLRALETTTRTAANQSRHADQLVAQYQLRAEITGKLISCKAPPLNDLDQHAVATAPDLWLDPQQQGRVVAAGTMLAAVCSGQQIAVLPLQDEQLADVAVGTPVRLLLPSQNDQIWNGQVTEIVQLDKIDSLSRLLNQHPEQLDSSNATHASSQAKAPVDAAYAAIVFLPADDLPFDASVEAVFNAHPRTLAARASAWARKNLRWLVQ